MLLLLLLLSARLVTTVSAYKEHIDYVLLISFNYFSPHLLTLCLLLMLQPQAKGDEKFFQQQYGTPDGSEDLKFAKAACWPTRPAAIR